MIHGIPIWWIPLFLVRNPTVQGGVRDALTDIEAIRGVSRRMDFRGWYFDIRHWLQMLEIKSEDQERQKEVGVRFRSVENAIERDWCAYDLRKRIHNKPLSHVLDKVGRLLPIAQLLVRVDAASSARRICKLFPREIPSFVSRHLYVHTIHP